METIAIYFTPLAATKILGKVGFGLAYHMAIVYTNANGLSFGASSGPSIHMTPQTPAFAFQALVDSTKARPSPFGLLMCDPKNNHPFFIGHPDDYYTQDFSGKAYPSATIASGPDLSGQWKLILRTYTQIGALKLTYSPISQNSNSVAANAVRCAGFRLPFSSETSFSPGEFTAVLMSQSGKAQCP